MREQLQLYGPPPWLDHEIHGQADKKKKSFSSPIHLPTNGSGKMESFLSSSPAQEAICPQLQTAFDPEGLVDRGQEAKPCAQGSHQQNLFGEGVGGKEATLRP